MEKDFIPYQPSFDLKELGFDEPCVRGWYEDGGIWYHPDSDIILDNPTFSQAFRWFREKYNIVGIVKNLNTRTTNHKFYAEIVEPVTVSSYSIYDTYEEAELECLKKLIEIVKEK